MGEIRLLIQPINYGFENNEVVGQMENLAWATFDMWEEEEGRRRRRKKTTCF